MQKSKYGIQQFLKENNLTENEYRQIFKKIVHNEPLNVPETKSMINFIDNKNNPVMLPNEQSDELIDSSNNSSELIRNLDHLFNINSKDTRFSFPVAVIEESENTLKQLEASYKTSGLFIKISESYALTPNIDDIIFIGLKNQFVSFIDSKVITADGSDLSHYGLPVAGSGTDGAYVLDTDLVQTTSITEANLISLSKMVKGHPKSKYIMNETTFLDNVLPLMATSNFITQNSDGKYLIGQKEIILNENVPSDVIYASDLSYLVGDYSLEFAARNLIKEFMNEYRLLVKSVLLPAAGYGAFAKLEIVAE